MNFSFLKRQLVLILGLFIISSGIFPVSAMNQINQPLAKAEDGSVYRFYNPETSKHVMMMDYLEANNLYQFNKAWKYDGVVFMAFQYDKAMQLCKTEPSNLSVSDVQPVYRFYNPLGRTHFFALGSEVQEVERNTAWTKEGVVFCAAKHSVINSGLADTFRYYYPGVVSHVFTADFTERNLINSNPAYIYEGVPFKVFKQNAMWGNTTYKDALTRADAIEIIKSIESKYLTLLNLSDIATTLETSWDYYSQDKIESLFTKAETMIQTEKLQINTIIETPETIPLKGALVSVVMYADEHFKALKNLYYSGKNWTDLDPSLYDKRMIVQENLIFQFNTFKNIFGL